MKRMFDAFFHVDMHRKEAQMGKSLNGKELGRGITQRKSDGLYQGSFVNRFGRTQTIYAKTLNEIRQKLRTAQYEDDKVLNVISRDMTLDEWYKTAQNPAEDFGACVPSDDNGFVLSCDRGYPV